MELMNILDLIKVSGGLLSKSECKNAFCDIIGQEIVEMALPQPDRGEVFAKRNTKEKFPDECIISMKIELEEIGEAILSDSMTALQNFSCSDFTPRGYEGISPGLMKVFRKYC